MTASAIDLTTVTLVKNWLSANGVAPTNTLDDDAIQACVTAFSATFLQRTSRGPQDGSFPAASPFVAPVTYTEVYDGNGHDRLFVRNSPIQSVTSVIIGPYTIPHSTGWGVNGWEISGSKKYLFMRGGASVASFPGLGGVGAFAKGTQNVQIMYSAGYSSTPIDIQKAATKTSALEYKRKDWIGLVSKAMANGAGTVSYRDWEYDPDVENLIANYTRWTL